MTDQPKTFELLPCPFCGSKDGPGVWMNHRVVCGGCDAEGPSLHEAMEANVAAWNTRAAPRVEREALTLAQLNECARDAQIDFCMGKESSFEVAFARHIEAAHGIAQPARAGGKDAA